MKGIRNILLLSILLVLDPDVAVAQDAGWRAGVNTFFDNVEFGGSSYKVPQTMSGVWFEPGIDIKIDTLHRISAGIGMLHEFGSSSLIDSYAPSAWYEYSGKAVRFMMGAFPRKEIQKGYPRIFFSDSVFYYRPNINGIYLSAGNGKDKLSVWLDWTGRQSMMVREAFFIGLEGRIHRGPFYMKHNSYMYHYAGTSDPADVEPLHDNSLFLTAAGANYIDIGVFSQIDISLGWVLALERSRGDNTGWLDMHGLLFEIEAEAGKAGIRNSFYSGSRLFTFYSDHSNELYWGDPAYRSGTYNRSDIFIKFFDRKSVDLELMYSLHFTEGAVFHEQMLRLGVNLSAIRF